MAAEGEQSMNIRINIAANGAEDAAAALSNGQSRMSEGEDG
jgi:hypothetical protein